MTSRAVDRTSHLAAAAATAGILLWIYFVSNGASVAILSFGVAGVAVTFLVNRWSVANFLLAAAGGSAIAIAYFATNRGYVPGLVSAVMLPAAFLGLGSLFALVVRSWTDPDALKIQLCGSFIPLFTLATVGTGSLYAGRKLLYDNHLLRMDEILTGTHPSFAVGRFVAASPVLENICLLIYNAMPLMLILPVAMALKHPSRLRLGTSFAVIALTAVTGGVVYQICPAAGPRYVFQFPSGEPAHAGDALLSAPGAPINASPSLHVTWALLVFLYLLRVNKWLSAAAAAFVVATVMATLAVGEHYLVDLMIAVPFTLMMHAGIEKRYYVFAAGALATIGCQFYVRLLPHQSFMAIGFVALLFGSLLLLVRISRAPVPAGVDQESRLPSPASVSF